MNDPISNSSECCGAAIIVIHNETVGKYLQDRFYCAKCHQPCTVRKTAQEGTERWPKCRTHNTILDAHGYCGQCLRDLNIPTPSQPTPEGKWLDPSRPQVEGIDYMKLPDDAVIIRTTYGQIIPTPEAWEERLEQLAVTEPDPNAAVYNLPRLKAFIKETIKEAEERGKAKAPTEKVHICPNAFHLGGDCACDRKRNFNLVGDDVPYDYAELDRELAHARNSERNRIIEMVKKYAKSLDRKYAGIETDLEMGKIVAAKEILSRLSNPPTQK